MEQGERLSNLIEQGSRVRLGQTHRVTGNRTWADEVMQDVMCRVFCSINLGETSNAALQRVKRIYFARKAVIPAVLIHWPGVCCRSASALQQKNSAFLLDADKRYWVRVKLGETRVTGDAEGAIVETRPTEGYQRTDISGALHKFIGEIQQIPPRIPRPSTRVSASINWPETESRLNASRVRYGIHELELHSCRLPEFELNVHCSKGTYIRTLVE